MLRICHPWYSNMCLKNPTKEDRVKEIRNYLYVAQFKNEKGFKQEWCILEFKRHFIRYLRSTKLIPFMIMTPRQRTKYTAKQKLDREEHEKGILIAKNLNETDKT